MTKAAPISRRPEIGVSVRRSGKIRPEEPAASLGPAPEVKLLTEIRDLLKK
jgi:large-conductance mechanosensitive channel